MKLLYLVTLSAVLSLVQCECPTGCLCPETSVSCQPNTVTEIPRVGPNATSLTLTKNMFTVSTLARRNFTAMTQMEMLRLRDCAIEAIDSDAFVGEYKNPTY